MAYMTCDNTNFEKMANMVIAVDYWVLDDF